MYSHFPNIKKIYIQKIRNMTLSPMEVKELEEWHPAL